MNGGKPPRPPLGVGGGRTAAVAALPLAPLPPQIGSHSTLFMNTLDCEIRLLRAENSLNKDDHKL